MLLATLWFGMLWQALAPHTVVPGMTMKQVEAILGPPPKPTYLIFSGSVNNNVVVRDYPNWKVSVWYDGERVKQVDHRK